MNFEDTYFPLFRSMITHRYMTDANKFQFWVWCLLKASHKQHKVLVGNQTITLEVGQFIFGRKKAAEELGQTERGIRTLLNFFSSEKEQKLTIKTTNKFSVITVMKYDTYMDKVKKSDQVNDQQVTSNRPASDHKQEGKEGKEEKEKTLVPDWVPLEEWKGFMDMRKSIKKPLTGRAVNLAISKLEKLKDSGEDVAEVLNQSTFKSYLGLFKVQKDFPTHSKQEGLVY